MGPLHYAVAGLAVLAALILALDCGLTAERSREALRMERCRGENLRRARWHDLLDLQRHIHSTRMMRRQEDDRAGRQIAAFMYTDADLDKLAKSVRKARKPKGRKKRRGSR